MRVVIVHGWGADSRSNWFLWLKNELEKAGVTAFCPDLPSTFFPRKNEWVDTLKGVVKKFDGSVVLVGHSLGCPTILRVLETLGEDEKILAAILVAGFGSDIGIPEIKNFVEDGFDWEKIKRRANEFFVINSDDDPYVPLKEGKSVAEKLHAKFIVEKGGGHLNAGTANHTIQKILMKLCSN